MLALDAYNHAVWRHEVFDGVTLLQELRVRSNVELNLHTTLLQFLLNGVTHLAGRTNGNRRLRDHHDVLLQVLANSLGHLQHIFQIGRAVLIGRCAYSREDNLNVVEYRCQISSELQTASSHILLHQLIESRLVDGHLATLQALNLIGIDVYTRHVSTCVGETCA